MPEPMIPATYTRGKIRSDGVGKIGLVALALYLWGIAEFLKWAFH
jgi:hypothetical protein